MASQRNPYTLEVEGSEDARNLKIVAPDPKRTQDEHYQDLKQQGVDLAISVLQHLPYAMMVSALHTLSVRYKMDFGAIHQEIEKKYEQVFAR